MRSRFATSNLFHSVGLGPVGDFMNNQQLIDLLRDDRSTALAAMTDAQCHRLTEHGYLGREDYDRRDNIICTHLTNPDPMCLKASRYE
jgi:hypothetical protein